MLTTGMPVQVELTAYPEKAFPGTLVQLSSLGQDRADLAPPGFEVAPASQAMFRGIVEFDPVNTKIQPGMSALVHIMISPLSSKLVLPRESIGYIDRIPHVYTRQGKSPVPIQGQIIDSTWFEVTGGLDEDAKILRRFPLPAGDRS